MLSRARDTGICFAQKTFWSGDPRMSMANPIRMYLILTQGCGQSSFRCSGGVLGRTAGYGCLRGQAFPFRQRGRLSSLILASGYRQ